MGAMEGAQLTATAFMAMVESHVRTESKRRGLTSLDPSAPGFWLRGQSFARILWWTDGGVSLLLHRLGGDYRSKILREVEPNFEQARAVAGDIVVHLLAV
jgi:hypothetical protein